ncbi:hypothetical protein PZC41_14205 [Staphylococcus aureus]|uniref:hypothetical protein n=1 Tax=Staphylococcus aureus TaxID=1280 RepID=UPI0023AFC995|nr:hypothetical protein [Staphylococcus aureus]MDE8535457.1 hypothetical protein [Staphylococcus aureus]
MQKTSLIIGLAIEMLNLRKQLFDEGVEYEEAFYFIDEAFNVIEREYGKNIADRVLEACAQASEADLS